MAANSSTPTAKQRVRTGCLTCRKRRRKCDERKPRCENCQTKGFPCSYPNSLTFVKFGKPQHRQFEDVSNDRLQAYTKIKFVEGYTPTRHQEATRHDGSENQATLTRSDIPRRSYVSPTDEENHIILPAARALGVEPGVSTTENSPTPFGSDFFGDTASENPANLSRERTISSICSTTCSPDKSIRGLFAEHEPCHKDREVALLHHFRYYICPWLDVSDPESPFGTKIMLLAKECRPLMSALLAFTAHHRSLVYARYANEDLESRRTYRLEAGQGLDAEGDIVKRVGYTFFLLDDLLCLSPLQWTECIQQSRYVYESISCSLAYEALNEPVFWLYIKTDLSASVLGERAPFTPLDHMKRLADSFMTRSPQSPSSQKHTYQSSLLILAKSLSLVYGDPEKPSLTTGTTGLPETATAPSPWANSPTQWISLWAECQRWFNNRPVEMQAILEIPRIEAGQINPHNRASFPIRIFTASLALVANVIYHMTSLLLLTHKPRLLKNLGSPRDVASHIWHAQSIAGIVTSNHSLEQWEPMLAAGIILAAKEMTHPSQHIALLEVLDKISVTTGIKLDKEVKALQSNWCISRAGQSSAT